jgi:hypothetical protein
MKLIKLAALLVLTNSAPTPLFEPIPKHLADPTLEFNPSSDDLKVMLQYISEHGGKHPCDDVRLRCDDRGHIYYLFNDMETDSMQWAGKEWAKSKLN